MADKKYGNIYTEKEVLAIIDRVANTKETAGIAPEQLLDEATNCAGPFDQYVDDGGALEHTFPVDEPLFILRAKDKAAPATISSYYQCAENVGAGTDHLESVEQASIDFQTWQESNPDLVKTPD